MKKEPEPTPKLDISVSGAPLLTKEDLRLFKEVLLRSIFAMLQAGTYKGLKKWLKSEEVKKLINISPGTLQTLRNKGIIPYKRIGGLLFYDVEDIHRLLSGEGDKKTTTPR